MQRRHTPTVLLALLVLAWTGSLLWGLRSPDVAHIFDEKYYVNAARVILGRDVPCTPVCEDYHGMTAGLDPNSEHPPLGKLIIAGSMRVLGDNWAGWRLPSVLFAVAALLLLHAVARRSGASPWVALGACALLATDTLLLLHGRIATLDIYLVTFMLLGVWLWLRGLWPLAGVALGLSALVKLIGGVEGVLVLSSIEALLLLRRPASDGPGRGPFTPQASRRRRALRRGLALLTCTAVCAATYLGLLWVLDQHFSAYHNPIAHTQHMLDYASHITSPDGPNAHPRPGLARDSYPWQWLFDIDTIDYFATTVTESVGRHVVSASITLSFEGAINPAIILLLIPAAGVAVVRMVRRADGVSMVGLAWFLGTWLPFLPLSHLLHRTVYIYYMVPVLPGVYLLVARLLSRPVPFGVRVLYAVLLLIGYVWLYPIRSWGLCC